MGAILRSLRIPADAVDPFVDKDFWYLREWCPLLAGLIRAGALSIERNNTFRWVQAAGRGYLLRLRDINDLPALDGEEVVVCLPDKRERAGRLLLHADGRFSLGPKPVDLSRNPRCCCYWRLSPTANLIEEALKYCKRKRLRLVWMMTHRELEAQREWWQARLRAVRVGPVRVSAKRKRS